MAQRAGGGGLMNDHGTRDALVVLRQLDISKAMVRAHVIRPDHLQDAVTGVEPYEAAVRDAGPPSGRFYSFDIEGFGREVHALLSSCVAGYAMQLRRRGQTVLAQQWRWARTSDDGNVAWTQKVPMHVASVSKLITAMAVTKLLRDQGMSPDATIAPWLPDYWRRGPDVDRITFRHLLTHTSGLVGPPDSPHTFSFMKSQIEWGARDLGQRLYQNSNFGLCRILLSTVGGTLPTSATFKSLGMDLTDQFWDITSINAYKRYVAANVFAAAGVSAPTLDHPNTNALAYSFPVSGKGWDSGDLSVFSGGVAWHMSVDELLAVMGAFRRRGTIVSPADATAMLDQEFGLELRKDTPLGRLYAKGGFWTEDKHGRRVEQCNAFLLPKDMELVVFANSPFCAQNRGFMSEVTTAIEHNIQGVLVRAVSRLIAVLKALFRRRRAKSDPGRA